MANAKNIHILRNAKLAIATVTQEEFDSLDELGPKNSKFFEDTNIVRILIVDYVTKPTEFQLFFTTPQRLPRNISMFVCDYYKNLNDWELTSNSESDDLILTDINYDIEKKLAIPVVKRIQKQLI